MKKYEKEVVQSELNNEKAVLKNLKRAYQEALFEVDDKIAQLLGRSDADQQHVIYQVEYQRALKKQINGILDALHTKEFETISEYLSQTYDEGFIGTLYTMQAQGVPLAFPINQELVVSAIQHETMLTSSLYTELGLSIQTLKKEIASEISRGMVNSLPYKEIARNVANRSNIPLNKAMTIARTEGHRIRETAADHTRTRARQAGADVIDFWDAALDGKTRTTHRMLDGQRRNKKGYFEANGKRARYPGDFGDPAEDVNCRCRVRSEASWALDEGDTKMLGNVSKMSDEEKQEIADKLGIPVGDLEQYSGQIVPIKAKNYDDFKQQYSKLWRYDDGVPVRTSSSVRSSAQKMKGEVVGLPEYTVGDVTYKVDGKHVILDNTEHEKEVAHLLSEVLGEKVSMVPRVVFPQGVSTPDYIIGDRKFDLKEPTGQGKNVLYNMVHKKKSQANNFIFDISKCPLDYDTIKAQAEGLFNSAHTAFIDEVIIIKDGKIVEKFKRKK